jgi:hypothetical protein
MIEGFLKWFERFGISSAIIVAIIGVALLLTAFAIVNVALSTVISYAIALSPIWLPTVLFFLFFEKWMQYIKKSFKLDQGNTTLEILLPEEILKSPLAMELVLTHFFQKSGPDNLLQTYIDGKHPPTFSLEIVSDGGKIRFFINTPKKKFKNIIETQLYSQYPGIEVRELDVDYTAEIDNELKEFDLFSIHFGIKKADVYPIKTYIDYGLDKDPKEEFKIDPMTQMLDMMGSIGPNERIWIQILISAHRKEDFEVGSLHLKPDWTDDIKAEINKIVGRDAKKLGPAELESQPRLTEGERNVVKALERSLSKTPFNTAIRAVYAAKKGYFLPGERIGALITSWAQYGDNMLNSIALKWRTDYSWPWWQDPSGKKRAFHKKRELKEYKLRAYDPQTGGDGTFVMTNEELATIFHLPGKVAGTPTLGRIPSARAEAPPNLPIGNF